MREPLRPYLLAALGVGSVAWLTASFLPILGLASSALLFLLPVLFSSSRGGLRPGLFAAFLGGAAYNFLLLPPRLTFRIHGFDNVVSVVVLFAVALVTSRLATRLEERRAVADARAKASAEAAELAGILAKGEPDDALNAGTKWLEARYGSVKLIGPEGIDAGDSPINALDASAAAWALHNGDMTGHSTRVMAAAEWTYLPIAPRNRGAGRVIAFAQPTDGAIRTESELAQLQQLAYLLGQGWDRTALARERHERERLEISDRLRRGVLASLAHDFRTPLTVIAGHLEALAANAPEAGEALAATRRLDRMMEDLLGAARLESGELAPALENLDLVDAVSAASATAIFPADVKIMRELPQDLPFVRADPMLLHHILLNLLDNAGRHACTWVGVKGSRQGNRVLLTIADDGPGIPIEDRERLFERFVRLDGSDRRHGSGLGLSIVKGFADAMNIDTSISDHDGGGACFTLSLPAAGASE